MSEVRTFFFFLTFKKYIDIRLRSGPWKSWGHLPICQFSSPRSFQPVFASLRLFFLPVTDLDLFLLLLLQWGCHCQPVSRHLRGKQTFTQASSHTHTALRATGTCLLFLIRGAAGSYLKTETQGGWHPRGFGKVPPRCLQRSGLSGSSWIGWCSSACWGRDFNLFLQNCQKC